MRHRMHQQHNRFRACPQQPRIDKCRAVVDIDADRDAARGQRRLERRGEPDRVFGVAEPLAHHEAGVVIKEGE